MSGSYDRPAMRPPGPARTALGPQPAPPDYDEVPTSQPATAPARAPSEPSTPHPTLSAPVGDRPANARGKTVEPGRSHAPIVPAGSVTGRSLTLVVSIMCFLACLTAGAVYLINQSASAWLRDIASEVTVQIEPRDKVDTEKTVSEVALLLAAEPGIAKVKPMTIADSSALLEPWLGQSEALKSLPVPRLIAIELDRSAPPDLAALRKQLADRFPAVTIDDHRQWQRQIQTVTRSFALGGLAILVLVAAATTAIIVSATRSAMASNREIVEVLHFVGATDGFIAREFEKHFLRLGIRAGLVGAVSAMLVFTAMPHVMELLGGGTITMAELHRLIGSGTLDAAGYVLLGIVVVVIAALCMLTSRVGVFRILNSQH